MKLCRNGSYDSGIGSVLVILLATFDSHKEVVVQMLGSHLAIENSCFVCMKFRPYYSLNWFSSKAYVTLVNPYDMDWMN